MSIHATPPTVGRLLRDWRQARALSQLDLALMAEVSQRHLSFVESGRANPSREMILRLSRHLDVPLRERNALLLAAGHAPVYRERKLNDPSLFGARKAIDVILERHSPNPALAVDRHWTLLVANAPALALMAGVSPDLLVPPVNVMRISLHPRGLAPSIVNLAQWRGHVLDRLERQARLTRDASLEELLKEIAAYPVPSGPVHQGGETERPSDAEVAVPLVLTHPIGTLSFISTTTIFGTAVEVTLSELVLETFYPMDDATADALSKLVSP
jgi:transcriptional regulator with XRE-family HTH domain